jgi:aminoacyl tRNA synthase complex-interacting multifunctional protein 2
LLRKKKIQPIDTSLLSDIVINANPDNIPYGILALKNLWKDRLQIVADTYVHSTIANFPENAVKFSEMLSKRDNASKLPALKTTIIWKDTDVTSMVSSASKYVPIYGEINIMRYLNRVGPKEFNYDKSSNAFQATVDDSVLDMCYVLSQKETTHKERQFYLQQLNQRLGKQKFFNGNDELSFVDMAVSSVLKQLSTKNPKDLPGNLPGFLARVSVKAGF